MIGTLETPIEYTQANINFFAQCLFDVKTNQGKLAYLPFIRDEKYGELFKELYLNYNSPAVPLDGKSFDNGATYIKFNRCRTCLSFIYQFFMQLADYNILEDLPGGKISDYAFVYSDIKHIDIPYSITSIGDGAFAVSDIEEFRLPEGFTKLPAQIFTTCSDLKTLYLPSSLEKIQKEAVAYCPALKDIFYNGTKKEWQDITKYPNAFEGTHNFVIHCTDGDYNPDLDQ